MKLPINFGNRLFFRIVLPGSVITAALSGLIPTIATASNSILGPPLFIVISTVAFGTVFLVLDMPIYMLFEGRRFWPRILFRWGRDCERGRLLRLYRAMRLNDVSRTAPPMNARSKEVANIRYLESAVDISNFPIDRVTSMPRAYWPTRLGNIVASYEQYPRLKYGLDAVFFWPRLWVSIGKDLRDEIDNQQSLADGLLYLTAALTLTSAAFLICAIVSCYEPMFPIGYGATVDTALFVTYACGSVVVYRISLHSHIQFGEYFKAVFDQHRSLLKFDDVVDVIASATNDESLRSRPYFDQNIAVWRLLRWHRVRLRGRTINQRVRLP